jgi:hypothetical protein
VAKEKKHKKKKCKQWPCSVFAPLFPAREGTPRTNYSGQNGPGFSGIGGGHASGGAGAPGSGPAPGGMVASIPPSRKKVIHEIRLALGSLFEGDTAMTADPAWKGYSAPSPALNMRQGGPQPSGAGFSPVAAGQGGRYDFQRSPGLGFRTEKAWRVWHGIVDILSRRPSLPIHAVMQAAMARAGVKFGDIDASEQRLLEMGVEWFLSDPKATQSKDSDGGGQSGFGAPQLNQVAT